MNALALAFRHTHIAHRSNTHCVTMNARPKKLLVHTIIHLVRYLPHIISIRLHVYLFAFVNFGQRMDLF